jgi:zinc protease
MQQKFFSVRNLSMPVIGFLLAGLFVSDSGLRADGKVDADKIANQAAAALYEGIRTQTLPNGLRVYLKPIAGAPVVTSMVAYKVGSADENLDSTGLSHYLEHLMFKGTDKIMPGEIDRRTLRAGGQNNAYTNEDMTNYHFDFSADNWEVALAIEADRMQNLRIDTKHEFEQEKGAVVAELDAGEDSPWDLEQKTILPILFGKGPYGHPVIGEREHVRGATAKIIKSHYDAWYHPNNAVLVLVGGFDADKAMAKIETLFGPIPSAQLPPRKPEVAIAREKPVHKDIVSKFQSPRMLMGFNTVRSGGPGFYALEVIQDILTGGKTGRLYTKLVDELALASGVSASNQSGRYAGWFGLQVEMVDGKSREAAEKAVVDELKRLQNEPVSAAELARVKRELLAHTIFARESVHGLADSIAQGVCINDIEYLKNYLPRIQAVSQEDVQKAAREFFKLNQEVVVWSVPPAAKGGKVPSLPTKPQRHAHGDQGGGAQGFSLENTQRHVLPNGLTLVLRENRRLPIVVADVALRYSSLLIPEDKAGVGSLVGGLLDEGTTDHTGPQIAEAIENVGGSLEFHSSGGSVKVLSGDTDVGLGLLFECLSRSAFPADAFGRKKAQFLSALEDRERQPDSRASVTFRQMVYGKHPFGRDPLGTKASLGALAVDDCKNFYKEAFVPNNTICVLVGDFDSKQMIEKVTRLTAGWKSTNLVKPKTPEVTKPESFVQKILMMPEAAQLYFFMGHVGIRRNNEDFYKLLVMDYVLGTSTGFNDRLSARLRDREGLAYTVSANITGSSAEEPGIFSCYIGTQPVNLDRAKKEFLEEITRLRKEKPTAQEVEDVKLYLIGSLPFKVSTNERVAALLMSIERYHLGLSYLSDYKKAVSAVTPEDVQAVAQKYLDPEHMVLVVAGPVDEKGKPTTPK